MPCQLGGTKSGRKTTDGLLGVSGPGVKDGEVYDSGRSMMSNDIVIEKTSDDFLRVNTQRFELEGIKLMKSI